MYTIFAGINGAGKSSLYKMLSNSEWDTLGLRLNVDERVAERGDWRDAALQVKCAKEILTEINDCIKNNVSFNQETTLSGMTTVRKIIQAKEKGFFVRLYYVFIESPDLAIKRITERVSRGGHGIPDELVRERFRASLDSLKIVVPYCDKINIYDNTNVFKLVARIDNGKIIDKDIRINKILDEYLKQYS
jgi:predicted ABC-type ATPase